MKRDSRNGKGKKETLTSEFDPARQLQHGQIVLERHGIEVFVSHFGHDVYLLRPGSVRVVVDVVLTQLDDRSGNKKFKHNTIEIDEKT